MALIVVLSRRRSCSQGRQSPWWALPNGARTITSEQPFCFALYECISRSGSRLFHQADLGEFSDAELEILSDTLDAGFQNLGQETASEAALGGLCDRRAFEALEPCSQAEEDPRVMSVLPGTPS